MLVKQTCTLTRHITISGAEISLHAAQKTFAYTVAAYLFPLFSADTGWYKDEFMQSLASWGGAEGGQKSITR